MRSKRRPFCNRADTDCNIVRRESLDDPALAWEVLPSELFSGDVVAAKDTALAQTPVRQRHGMGKDRALGFGQGNGAEAHYFRKVLVICAMIDTAISAGVLAPISRPTGA